MQYSLLIDQPKPHYEEVVLNIRNKTNTKENGAIPVWKKGSPLVPVLFDLTDGEEYDLCLEYFDPNGKTAFGMSCWMTGGQEKNGFMNYAKEITR
jgi:hypothetical protein